MTHVGIYTNILNMDTSQSHFDKIRAAIDAVKEQDFFGGNMKIFSIWNQKGGVGKTTLTLQLAGFYALDCGMSVLIIDLDEQQSATDIFKMNRLGGNIDVIDKMPRTRPNADIVLIDHPPGTQQIPETQKVIIPFQPSILSYKAAMRSIDFLTRRKKKIFRVLNGVDTRKSEHLHVKTGIFERSPADTFFVNNRAIYERSLGQGVTVFHPEIKNLHGIGPAKNEIGFIGNKILKGEK